MEPWLFINNETDSDLFHFIPIIPTPDPRRLTHDT